MANEHIERRTYVGETAVGAFDGFAGFRIGQSYQLRYTREFDEVRIALDHAATPGLVSTMTVENFNKWFVKG
jgi:hypothetical protein